jgi:hypothetical protein
MSVFKTYPTVMTQLPHQSGTKYTVHYCDCAGLLMALVLTIQILVQYLDAILKSAC